MLALTQKLSEKTNPVNQIPQGAESDRSQETSLNNPVFTLGFQN